MAKLHAPWTDGATLAARLRLAGDPALAGILLPPLAPEPLGVAGRWVTIWPRVDVVARDPDQVPWATAGTNLAALHLTGRPAGAARVPEHGAPERLRRGLRALGTARPATEQLRLARQTVLLAAESLPAPARVAWCTGRPRTLAHGDWHLGQLGRLRGSAGDPRWRLVDLDDLGTGDPVWDLERPAAMWACGLLADEAWLTLVDAYRSAGGPALPGGGDPWPVLDAVAQAGVVQAAAGAVRRAVENAAALDDVDLVLVETCARIGSRPAPG